MGETDAGIVSVLENPRRHVVAQTGTRKMPSAFGVLTAALLSAFVIAPPVEAASTSPVEAASNFYATASPARSTVRHSTAARGCANANTPANRASLQAMRDAVLCLVNRQRTSRRLPILHGLRRLDRSAQKWTDAMVNRDFFSHTGSGSDPGVRISLSGFPWSAVGENIATGFATPSSVVAAWMGSTGHCHNILSPQYSYVGTGVNRSPVGGFGRAATWTQDFGLPAGASSPSGNWGPANGCPY
jgi:uncharacterized protein YkwD